MDFALTDEQQDLQAAAARYLGHRYPIARIAELADGAGDDPDAWPELHRQGWCDTDLGVVELGLLAEESGYALHATPWWSTVGLTHPVYRAAGTAPPHGPLTLAWRDDPTADDGGCRATRTGAVWRLTGARGLVTDPTTVDGFVVAADTGGGGTALFAVPSDAEGLAVEEFASLDRLRRGGTLRFTAVAADPVPAPATEALTAARRRADALLACEAVGVARRALALAQQHAGTREQFGRPIGAYQAVAHRLADSYVAVELAKSLAYRAAWLVGAAEADDAGWSGPEDPMRSEVDAAVAVAMVAGRRAAVQVCEDALQVSGGLGATWEYPLHWWYRRALWLDSFDTPTTRHLSLLADRLLAGRA